MADILSNNELDDLLAAVDAGPQTGEQTDGRKISNYDFRRPSRLTRDHVHVLQPLNKAVAEGLSGQFSELLRVSVEVNAIGIDALPYSNFVSSLPATVCLNIFSLVGQASSLPINQQPGKAAPQDVGEKGLLTMDVPLALAIVDRLLGGAGVALDEIRPLTELEEKVIDLPISIALQRLTQQWSTVAEVDFKFEERRMDPKVLQIVPASEVVLRIIFAVGGQIGSGEMIFAVPFSAVDKMMPRELMKERFRRAPKKASESEIEALSSRLRAAPVQLTAVLGETKLTLKQLAELQVSHVLPLTRRVTTPLDLLVQGVPKFKVRLGRVGRTLSVQVGDD